MPDTTRATTPKSMRIGRGIADITGEPWGVGMMGYGMSKQWSTGILTRQYARAFVNITTRGFHRRTFDRIVDGVTDAIEQAHLDAAAATAVLNRGTLNDSSVNRSQPAFVRNTVEEQEFLPARVDPMTTLLRVERDGETVGVINWFAVQHVDGQQEQPHKLRQQGMGRIRLGA